MSDDQTNEANKFARQHFGGEVDAAAGAPGFKVLGPNDPDDGKPSIPWVLLPGRDGRDDADFAKELGAVMADAPMFRREDVLVTVEPFTGDMKLMTTERFLTWVSDHAVVYEWFETGKGANRTQMKMRRTMPKTTAAATLASDRFYYQVRPLVRVNSVRMPVMTADGRPRLLPEGYDEETQIFTLKSVVQVDESYTMEKAKLFLADHYGEFGFTDGRSLAVAIAMGVALFGMGLQPLEAARMGFMVRANTQGGGKSLVAQMAVSASYGWPKNTPRTKEDELIKMLASVVLQGRPYIFLDNLKGHFENAIIEGFMTSPEVSVRVMGTHRFMTGKVCTTLILTGNNLTVSPDMQRRVLQCDIFVEEFDLQEKSHRRDLNPVALNRPEVRSEFLSVYWALIRNWYELGRPPAGTREKPYRIAGFSEWSDIFGGIVQAAGYGNPLERPKDDQSASPITQHQRKLVELLSGPLEGVNTMMEYTAQEMIDCCVDNDLFTWKIKGKPTVVDGKDLYIPTSETWSVMGLMWTKEMGGRIFTLTDRRRVRFGKHGEGRAKRYTVEIVPGK